MSYRLIPFFRGALGLNTRVAPSRLTVDPETGLCELAEAVNVDIDLSRRISRRPGAKETDCTIPSHSLYSVLETTLFVSESKLCRLEGDGPEYSHTVLTALDSNARMSYLHVNSKVYFSNGEDLGIYDIDEGTAGAWEVGEYVGPRTDREFLSPPPGNFLEFYIGRIMIANGKFVWHTEPFAFNMVDYSQNFFGFPSNINMLRAVADGLYVGTHTGIYFVRGNFDSNFLVSSARVVEGTDVVYRKDEGQRDIVCTTTEGVLMLGVGGKVQNLTLERIEYPVQTRGTAYIYQDKYVVMME